MNHVDQGAPHVQVIILVRSRPTLKLTVTVLKKFIFYKPFFMKPPPPKKNPFRIRNGTS